MIRDVHCDKWEEARRFLAELALSGGEVYFRGQADAKWPLKSSLGRVVAQLAQLHNWNEDERRRKGEMIENQLVSAFQRAYRRLAGVPSEPEGGEPYELLAYAQHYGVTTGLLDWTTSPYIAAFFAFDGHKTSVFPAGRNVAVWALDRRMLDRLLYNVFHGGATHVEAGELPVDLVRTLENLHAADQPRVELIKIKGNSNRRIVYQEGLFTRVVNEEDDVEAYVRKRKEYVSGTVLTKIVIPGSQQVRALRDLALMAISPVTLMNDLAGAAATAFNEVVRLTAF